MNKPWMIWSLSGLCALVVFGAMGLLTRSTLSLERERVQAEAKAEFEGWIRIALWRMDTAAAGILAEENNKPISHFRDIELQGYGGAHSQSGSVKLHFEVKDGKLSSPLDGTGGDRELVGLRSLLQYAVNGADGRNSSKGLSSEVARQQVNLDTNLELLCAVAESGSEIPPENPSWQAQVDIAQQQRKEKPRAVVRNAQAYQANFNRAEKVKRQVIVSKAVANSMSPKVEVQLSPLIPVWLGSDLMLVREVSDDSGKRVQGVWLDGDAIRVSLLADINDLLPEARLEPVRYGVDVLLSGVASSGIDDPMDPDDPMVMAALPWRLLPGGVAMIDSLGWTPMRKNLLLAWIGVVLAALAAVVLLRGVVKLSERRASFVSSVTHELRTPLTTFSLYSGMLSEGMVQDEKKRQEYLLTLSRESARLTHLVENVLAYSRIERGSARAHVESVRVGQMLERMEGRLRQRAEEAEMTLSFELSPEMAQHEIQVDTTAIEQIIFNLVDNACKYASGEGCGSLITLRAFPGKKRGRGVVFQVCDQGPGIQKSEHRRLFRAFHKSAQEAAHTQPGVGLGLALSRRLARALGGDLRIIEQESGACFELTVG